MLNVEKYKDKILSVKDEFGSFAIKRDTKEIVACNDYICKNCYFNELDNVCSETQNKWLLSEYEEEEKEENKLEEEKVLNIDKYRKEICRVLSSYDKFACRGFIFDKESDKIISSCYDVDCDVCIFGKDGEECEESIFKWLFEEYEEKKESIELTQGEYSFLYLLKNGYLVRDTLGYLHYYKEKPEKSEESRRGDILFNIIIFERIKDAFKFIKSDDKKPYSVEEILNNCRVKNE